MTFNEVKEAVCGGLEERCNENRYVTFAMCVLTPSMVFRPNWMRLSPSAPNLLSTPGWGN